MVFFMVAWISTDLENYTFARPVTQRNQTLLAFLLAVLMVFKGSIYWNSGVLSDAEDRHDRAVLVVRTCLLSRWFIISHLLYVINFSAISLLYHITSCVSGSVSSGASNITTTKRQILTRYQFQELKF